MKIGLRSSYFWAKWKQANKNPLTHPLRVETSTRGRHRLIYSILIALSALVEGVLEDVSPLNQDYSSVQNFG